MSVKTSQALAAPAVVEDEPLPQTLRFVLVLGVFIVVGWFAMFVLLQDRW